MSKNIILIDKRVQDYETIVAAIDPALAVGIVFDYFEDTFDALKARISALGLTNGTNQVSVGLIQHNYRAPLFSMLASADVAPVAQVATQDPELDRWVQIRDFITWCKTEHSAAHFDMMACALYSDPDWKYVIDTLTAQTGVTVRASTDDTGAASLGGDWFLESHTGVNMKTVYFTEAIEEYRGVLYSSPYNIRKYPTKVFATGSVVAWGYSDFGGLTPGNVSSGVVAVYSNGAAFAALKTDGSVRAWGYSDYGGSGAPTTVTAANSGVVAVYSNGAAFAALKTDGSVIAWGLAFYGGTTPGNVSSGVVAMCSTYSTFAALKTDGSVVAWGSSGEGGTTPGNVNSGVVAMYSNYFAFAALKTDGSVVAWGVSGEGGTTPENVSSGVVAVYSTDRAFAALKNDGSVVAWGLASYGGTTPSNVDSGVVAVYSTNRAFAALKNDGSIVAWGDSSYGGTGAPSSVTAANSGVVAIYSTQRAFAALKNNGSVQAWGDTGYGGTTPGNVSSGVVAVYSTDRAFAVLKTDGSIVAWGGSGYGGDSSSVASSLTSGVVAVYSSSYAFAALKNNGSVVAWGDSSSGGTAPGTVSSGVVAVYSTNSAFAALKTTATTFDLSMSYYTNADRYDILRKKENRRRVNLTTLNNNVFTLSMARDIQVINPNIPADKPLKIIVPTYVASSYSITSTATIPAGAGSVIIACDEGEPVTISGTTLVNYGAYVYRRETNNTYTKLSTATVNGTAYTLYGGDGINSSGIALVEPPKPVPVLSTFTVESSKTFGDASFSITTRPTSDSSGAITYISSNTAVATIDASGNWITLVAAGDVSFNAAQAATADYAAATKASNTLTVARGISNLSSSSTFSVEPSKTFGDASFSIGTRPTSNSTGTITYSSSNPDVATIDASGNWITLVGAGDVSFNATQEQTAQYLSATKASNTLTVARGISNLSASSTFTVESSKTFGDASFEITARPTSNSTGAITYSSSNPAVATIDASGNWINLVGVGDVSFNAVQAQTAQYFSATKASNTLTVIKATPTLAFSSPPTTKNLTDAAFTVVASSASSGAVTYSSSNTAFATVGASTGLVTLKGVGTVTITASQAASALYNAPTNTTCSIVISSVGSTLAGQTVPPGTSFAGLNLSGASLVGTTLSGVSFSGATLTNANFFGANITGTDFTNANISGATNLPAFSTAQKLQLLSNINNVAISEIQINTQELSGQTVSPGTSFAGLNLSGASLAGTTLSGVSFSGATLTNANFSGATITGADFTNANISGATNLPTFSPVQKLQLLKNINNVAIEAIQITTASGSAVAQLLSNPIAGIDNLTFSVVTPTTVDVNSNKTVNLTSAMIGSSNVYLPINTEEPIVINGTLYRSNGTNIIDANDAIVNFVTIDGVPFRVYAGSFVGINTLTSLNSFKIDGDGLYDILSELFQLRST